MLESPPDKPNDQPPSSTVLASPVGFWWRALAKMADRLLTVIAACVISGIIALLHIANLPGLWAFCLWFVLLVTLEISYFALLTSHYRQTLGYWLIGARVQTMRGQPVGGWRSLGRAALNSFFFTLLTTVLVGVIDYLWVAFSPAKRAVHDHASGTQVVRIGPPKSRGRTLGVLALLIIASLFAPGTLRQFLRSYYIPSTAMQSTLQLEDRLLVNMLYYRLRDPVFQELSIFRAPAAAGVSGDTDFIKRCMGLPGDVVEMKARQLWRNGRKVTEPYLKWSSSREGLPSAYDMKIVGGVVYARDYEAANKPGVWRVNGVPVPESQSRLITAAKAEAVPPGRFLMLGDHRNNSNDSHIWGLVPRAHLVGKPMLIFWPIERVRSLD